MLRARGSRLVRYAVSGVLLAFIAACTTQNPPLFEAAQKGDTRTIRALLAQGEDVNMRNSNGESALMVASHFNEDGAALLLLTKGSDVNARDNSGYTPLMAASSGGNATIILGVLARGAKVNEVSEDGTTALLAAAKKGRTSAVDILLNKGADMNARDKAGMTALGYAKQNKYHRLVKYLEEAGAKE